MSEWKEIKISDIADVNMQSINKNFKFSTIEYIDTSSVEKGRLVNIQIISTEEAPSRAKRRIKKNDVLISSVRPNLEHYYFVESCKENTVVSTGFVVVSPKKATYPYFLYCLLTTDKYTQYLTQVANSHTSTYPSFNPDIIYDSSFVIPDYPEQKQIADVLSCLDDKIDNLRRQNETLEAIAQTLFKHWFIDFEFPDADGKPYKSSGGGMWRSAIGDIPEGWHVGKLGEIIVNYDKSRIPLASNERQERQGKYPYYGAASIMDYVDDYIFDGLYILMGEDGTVIDKNGHPILQYVFGKFWANNHAHVLRGKGLYSTNFVYLFLKRTKINNIITGAVQPKINQANMNGISLVIPNIESIKHFELIINPIFKKKITNISQIQTLTKTREALLPKLMSGQLRIEE